MWSLPSETAAESDDDWDLGAVVRSCRSSTAPTAESSRNFSWFPMLRAAGEEEEQVTAAEAGKGGSFLGFPDLLQCSDGLQELEEVDTDGPLSQIPRPKRRKNQQKIVVRRLADDSLSSDVWGWRKYGQKPIKGSPYPRGYYRCSSSKSCLARKQVERNRADPATFIITYTAEHNHPAPAHRSSLAGSTRQKFPSLTLATAAAAGGGGTGERGRSPTTPLIGTMEGEDDDEEDEEVLLVEDMGVVVEDDLLFMNDERQPVYAGVATAQ